MTEKVLSVLVCLYAVHSVLKLGFFFVLSYKTRRKLLDRSYNGKTSATAVPDIFLLAFSIGLAVLLLVRGADHVSFLTGLLVGMTLIQLYFHRFSKPLPPEKTPDAPVSPIKLMSYAIQAMPARPWKEMLVIAGLLVWSVGGILWHMTAPSGG